MPPPRFTADTKTGEIRDTACHALHALVSIRIKHQSFDHRAFDSVHLVHGEHIGSIHHAHEEQQQQGPWLP